MPKLLNPRPANKEPNTSQTSNVEAQLRRKLDPRRFPHMSGKMAAVAGYIVGAEYWGKPPIRELIVTSDHFVLARIGDQFGFDTFFGSYADLVRNWLSLLQTAELSAEEWWEADCRFAKQVGFYGESLSPVS